MRPDTRTVTQLFELDVRYVVPLYQRPYVWDEELQWEPLWNDIVTVLEHHKAASGQPYSHFLGALVLDQVTQAPGKIPMYMVIDGQQRLTTLQILIAAASNAAADLGAGDISDLLRDLVKNNEKKVSGTDLLKVWPTNANRSAFQAVMADGGLHATREDDPDNRIDECYAFFHSRVKEWACEHEEDERLEALESLRITVCDLLKLVSITLEADDNAQVIFETLNARGTPLLALDLVKNAVFLEATRQKLDTDALYEHVWRPQLEDEYWRLPRRQGRLFRPNAELFLMHWLTMKLRHVVPATELFKTFRENFLAAAPTLHMTELISELCRDADILRSFEHLERGTVEATFFQRLEALDTSTVIPLVLFLFRETPVSSECRRRALQMLESWLVRRMLAGYTAKNYNQQIPTMIARVASDPQRADEIILSELRTGIGLISVWPRDDEVRQAIQERYQYGYISQARIAMILSAIEQSLYTSKVDIPQVPTGLSIEHILPQKWGDYWPLPEHLRGAEIEAATAARQSRLHRLGNLTLTTMPLNEALSNSAWSVKQKELNKYGKLLLNARLIEENPEVFDEESIDRRGAFLAERIVAIWPGPDAW